MHLNWFSPLPPALTDVAHFTARILPELSQRVQLTLWTPEKEYDHRLNQYADIRLISRIDDVDLAAADMNVFNVGNDRGHHRKILELALSHSGVIVLHDLFLPSLIRHRDKKNAPPNAADSLWFTQRIVSHSLAVIVHTEIGLKTLGQNQRLVVRAHPLPYVASDPPPIRTASTDSKKRLIIFGFLGSNRRLESVLHALHTYERRNTLHLDVFGTLSKPRTIRRLVKKLNLVDHVTIHGFASEAELERALTKADLAINLRYPTMGEASGSQLRIWDHALPSLVTPVGWYLDLPSDAVGYVDPKNEITDLHLHFDKLQQAPELYRRMGERGRTTLIAQHQPRAYADAIVNISHEAVRLNQGNKNE
jgi:glycosyltransferase involved in cell wall biosynthesis